MMPEPGSRTVDILRVAANRRSDVRDIVVVEEPLEVRVNGVPFAVTMRTPGADRALAAGFLLAEDVIHDGDEVESMGYQPGAIGEPHESALNVTVRGDAAHRLQVRLGERRQVMMTAACGLCGRRTIASLRSRVPFVDGRWTVPADVVARLPLALRQAQSVFDTTGGLHGAGLFSLDGAMQLMAEDVGRHNAVDKVIGTRVLERTLPLDRCMLAISGRASFELVQKALLAGVPLVAAVSAPSSLAIELADEARITLCGFVRGETFNVYTHPERLE